MVVWSMGSGHFAAEGIPPPTLGFGSMVPPDTVGGSVDADGGPGRCSRPKVHIIPTLQILEFLESPGILELLEFLYFLEFLEFLE